MASQPSREAREADIDPAKLTLTVAENNSFHHKPTIQILGA